VVAPQEKQTPEEVAVTKRPLDPWRHEPFIAKLEQGQREHD